MSVFWGDARYTKRGAIVHCFIVTVYCCVLCDASRSSLSFGISNITRFFFSFFLFREVQNTGKGRYDIVLLKLLNINWSVVKLSVIYNERGFCGVGSHLSKTTLTPLPHIHLKSIKNWYSS